MASTRIECYVQTKLMILNDMREKMDSFLLKTFVSDILVVLHDKPLVSTLTPILLEIDTPGGQAQPPDPEHVEKVRQILTNYEFHGGVEYDCPWVTTIIDPHTMDDHKAVSLWFLWPKFRRMCEKRLGKVPRIQIEVGIADQFGELTITGFDYYDLDDLLVVSELFDEYWKGMPNTWVEMKKCIGHS